MPVYHPGVVPVLNQTAMEKIEVQVIALSSSESSPGNFVVVLETVNTHQRIAIITGAFEAQSIAVHMERMQLPRPLTHDMCKLLITGLEATLKEVVIYAIVNGLFYAWLVLETKDKTEKRIDVRTSDAIALAVRFDAPIYAAPEVVNERAIQEEISSKSFFKGSVAEYTTEELHSLLQDVLAKEDYESASRIRDMIKQKGAGTL